MAQDTDKGFCNRCRRVWVLPQATGKCRWCGKHSHKQGKKLRGLGHRRSRKTFDRPLGEGYDQLPQQEGWTSSDGGFVWATLDWQSYYRIAVRFAHKALAGDKDDLLDDILEGLATVAKRKAGQRQDFSEPAMTRIAEHIKDHYWYSHYAYNNGLDCQHCTTEQRAKCRANWANTDWAYCDCHRAIQLESINQPAVDDEGRVTELADLIADDNALDLTAWIDARTFLIGAPIRLKVIATKRVNGEKLTAAESVYLTKLRKREQLSLV